ncbi:MAG: hypothetical protein Q4C95_11395 [Planctomycetia bacterium]|nr:hypothetical protein [Planctomycetia bacterium]
MTEQNRWIETAGKVRKNSLVRVKATLTTKAAGSTATASVGDWYEFNCKIKNFPAMTENPTWTVVTDNPLELTGRTYVGKSEGLEPIELTTETILPVVYGDLTKHRIAGDIFTLLFTMDDPKEATLHTLSIPDCQLTGVTTEGGETNSGPESVIKFQPEGGLRLINGRMLHRPDLRPRQVKQVD